VYWLTGNVDFLAVTMSAGRMANLVIGGWIVILVVAVLVRWRLRRSA